MQRSYRQLPKTKTEQVDPHDLTIEELWSACCHNKSRLLTRDLSNLDLNRINFSDLRKSNYTDGDLISKASFSASNLQYAKFDQLRIHSIDYRDADCTGASFHLTTLMLDEEQLKNTNLCGANLCVKSLSGNVRLIEAIYNENTICNEELFNYTAHNLEDLAAVLTPALTLATLIEKLGKDPSLPTFYTFCTYNYTTLRPLADKWRIFQDARKVAENIHWANYSNRPGEIPKEIIEIIKLTRTKDLDLNKQFYQLKEYAKCSPKTETGSFSLFKEDARNPIVQNFLDAIVKGNLDSFNKDKNQPLAARALPPMRPTG